MKIFNLTDVQGTPQTFPLGPLSLHPGESGELPERYVSLLNRTLTEYTRKGWISVEAPPPDYLVLKAKKDREKTFIKGT